jgi:hypothetical protein
VLVLGSLLFCAIRTKTLPAEDRSPTRRLEGYGVSLSALVAGNLESFALSTWSSRATKISTARIPARLTPLWVGQVPFLIVFLLSLSERKRGCTFRACNFKIWHGALFSMRARPSVCPLCSSERCPQSELSFAWPRLVGNGRQRVVIVNLTSSGSRVPKTVLSGLEFTPP